MENEMTGSNTIALVPHASQNPFYAYKRQENVELTNRKTVCNNVVFFVHGKCYTNQDKIHGINSI